MELIHVLVRPYVSTMHNIFDGVVLQLITTLSVLSIVEFVNYYNKTFVVVTAYILIILPLASFIVIKLWINRNKIKNTLKYWVEKFSHRYNRIPTEDVEEPINNEIDDVGVVIDDNMRKNAFIIDV